MTILGLSDVATEKEIGEEIKGHESHQWLRAGEGLSSYPVHLGKEKLADYHQCISELKGLELEGYLSDDSCGLSTDEEGHSFQTMTPAGKPLPLHDNLSLDIKVLSAREKRRNKKKKSKWMCQPCEITGMASFGPLTKDHFRTRMPKHPGCEMCRLSKPQAPPHLRISGKRKRRLARSTTREISLKSSVLLTHTNYRNTLVI